MEISVQIIESTQATKLDLSRQTFFVQILIESSNRLLPESNSVIFRTVIDNIMQTTW